MTHKIKPKLIRAYARAGITRLPIDVQKYEIERIAKQLELRIEWYIGTIKPKKAIAEERDLWARQLRCDEIGVVHSLSVLRLTRKQLLGADPKSDFSGFIASVGGLYLLEASTGLTSKDRAKWRKAVTQASKKPPLGSKPLTKAEASRIATEGWKTRNRGVVVLWKSDARSKELKHLIRHWRAADTAKTAHATLGEFIEEMGGGNYNELCGISEPTLRRIVNTKRT